MIERWLLNAAPISLKGMRAADKPSCFVNADRGDDDDDDGDDHNRDDDRDDVIVT